MATEELQGKLSLKRKAGSLSFFTVELLMSCNSQFVKDFIKNLNKY